MFGLYYEEHGIPFLLFIRYNFLFFFAIAHYSNKGGQICRR